MWEKVLNTLKAVNHCQAEDSKMGNSAADALADYIKK
jgi:hypothetical protein